MPQFGAHYLQNILRRIPEARALVKGSRFYPGLQGTVSFYQTPEGVMLMARIHGMPSGADPCSSNVFGFHIHEGDSCTGNEEDPFADTGGHYNPGDCPHPAHAGDLPPLFGNRGEAFMIVLTDRFAVADVVGRTVVIHAHQDDFTTQPSGNSGPKIACGKILPVERFYP